MPLPLEGYRILELSMMGAAPFAVRDLADMGAEVIKVEDPGVGDRSRGAFTWGADNVLPPHTYNYFYEVGNRGKKSVALNLREERGRQAFYRLLPHCDVLITSLRKPALRRMGADYATVSQYNPSLIYVHLGTFGPKGPDADLPGQDLTSQARSGFLNMMRPSPGGEPLPWGVFGVADMIASIQLAYATCLALVARERTGLGQEVHVSILGSMLTASQLVIQGYLSTGREPQPTERTQVKNPIRNIYRCADDKWICLGMSESNRFWGPFCQAIGRPDLAQDPRFADHVRRAEHSQELIAILDDVFLTRTRDEWYQTLKEHDCPAAKVQSYSEVAQDPQVVANEYVSVLDHPLYGPVKAVGVTVSLSKTPGRAKDPAPVTGQHTQEVLTTLARYSAEEIQELTRQGIAACAEAASLPSLP